MPDRALGASMKCPGCEAWYTAAPDVDAPPPRLPRSRAEADATPLAPDEPTPLAPDDSPIALLDEPVPRRPELASSSPPGDFLNIPGVIACLAVCVAILFPLLPETAFLTRPAAIVAVFLGAVAVLLALGLRPVAYLLPVLGFVASIVALVQAW